nr:GH32 C-terminal domain-containing protein [Entomoplasma sp. MP1]
MTEVVWILLMKKISSIVKFNQDKIIKLDILIDRSCLEVFVNEGEYTISFRFHLKNHETILTDFNDIEVIQMSKK